MNIEDLLKNINAVKILYSEKCEGGNFDGPFFDIYPEWLKQAYISKKLKPYISSEIDYLCWTVDNEYGDPIIFYPKDYIVSDGNGKIYGLEHEIVKIFKPY